MALSFELSGEQMPTSFNAGVPPLAQLQPLQFQQIALPAAQYVPDASQQRIQQGMSDLGKGIAAAYLAKREDAKDKEKFAQQKELKQMELANAKVRAEESLKAQKEMVDYRARIKGTTPKTPKFYPVPRPDGEKKEQEQPSSSPFRNINLPNTFEDEESPAPSSDSTYDIMKGVGGEGQEPPAPDKSLDIKRPPLTNLTSPVQGNQVDLFRELKNLGPVDAKYVSASSQSGATQTPALPLGQQLDWLRKPVSVLKSSGSMPADYEQSSKLLNSMTTPADIATENAKTQAVSGDTPLSAAVVTNERPPRGRFQYEEDALDYIQSHSKNSNWFAKENPEFDSKSGTWSVKWEQKDPAKIAQADATRQMAKDRLSRLDQAGLASEVDKFNKDPIYKIMQARPMQIAEFEAARDEAFDPNTQKSRRAVDLDAIDKFVMFARGTQPTEAQYSEIQNWTQGYLQDVKQKIEKGVEGARLSENDYETMMNLMYRAYNTTATLVNPDIQDLRDIVKTKHPALMEKELPRVHMYYEVPSYFREKLNDAQDEMRQYHALMDLAKSQQNKEQFDAAKAKYDEAKTQQDKIASDLARAKASKKPLNKKQFRRGGWPQGMFGGVSDLSAAGASQDGQ
jgi:hypothetical protein